MNEHSLLFNAFVYLLAAVLAVPISKRLGFGAVLGYLLAGVVIGPWGLRLIREAEDILHFAEFGVVLLLFAIGLELNPTRLWAMRKPILGLGGAQVVVSTAVLTGIGLVMGLQLSVAVVAAMGLSLSSTAMALQLLTERNLLPTPAGHSGFSVLLFQDIAVIPMLAVIPLLGVSSAVEAGSGFDWLALFEAIGVILLIVVGGRFALRPVLRLVASTELREVFTAFSLLLVIATSLLMQAVGMSMALGAFLAGVLLAESEYRHALESDIEPFKGLLLGLFFIAVGMSIDFGILLRDPILIAGLALSLVMVKAIILYVLGRIYGLPSRQLPLFALVLSQGGEFAFVLFGVAQSFSVFPVAITDTLIVTVALSMLTTPLLMVINDRFIAPRLDRVPPPPMDEMKDQGHPVIIAGFGRFGQIVGRLLHANGIDATVLEHDPDHIETLRRFRFKVFYGDACRLDLLRAAGADRAQVLVIAIDEREGSLRLSELVRENFPHLQIVSRAWDLAHVFELLEEGADVVERETFEAALRLGEEAMKRLGFTAWRAKQAAHRFRAHDEETLRELYQHYHDEFDVRIRISADAREHLREIMQSDEDHLTTQADSDWRLASKAPNDGKETQ
ncbi:MAG: glutathione-regulated potassium-efflux system protein KefC [Gammaproteobacteria bacterium]|nr:glutathione-regulated potassium-efflux system protein KefC [Gammaproteobacteria bacterium]